MKRFYNSPWFAWLIMVLVIALTGNFNAAALVILSLFALAMLGRHGQARKIYDEHDRVRK